MTNGITFKNRTDAGRLLGMELNNYRFEKPVVLAIARGGVDVGYQVALQLDCEFTVVVVRKLGYLNLPEEAFGALAEDGSLYFNSAFQRKLSKEEINTALEREKKEIARRVQAYRKGSSLTSLKKRTVIIVDDGIATGSTIFATIELCKKQKPDKIIVAIPVCAKEIVRKLILRVDDVVVLTIPDSYFSVSQVYTKFPGLNDQEVIQILNRWKGITNLIETLSPDFVSR
jgi:putative phosphoribosyl transferase